MTFCPPTYRIWLRIDVDEKGWSGECLESLLSFGECIVLAPRTTEPSPYSVASHLAAPRPSFVIDIIHIAPETLKYMHITIFIQLVFLLRQVTWRI